MLQNDLHKLYKWADANNMKFNANKFKLLRYGKEQEIKSAKTYKSFDDSYKGQRQDGVGVESVSVAVALSHADTLEISCHSPTRVLLPALESMKSKRHTNYRSYSTNVYIQNH